MLGHSIARLDHLPDEILVIILKNLENDQVLDSFLGVNQRLSQLVHDSIFTSDLTLMKRSVDQTISPFSQRELRRFCEEILPEIRQKIQYLNVESSSMERILSLNYPNLHGLALDNLPISRAMDLFTNEKIFTDSLKNAIRLIRISVRMNEKEGSIALKNTNLLINLLTIFPNLQSLNFDPSSINHQYISFANSPPNFISSTLRHLHVSVGSFNDCLHLLDGRFDQLQSLDVNISWIHPSTGSTNHQTENVIDLKCFSLHCGTETSAYDQLILPLLHRMFNLEKLDLYLVISCKKEFIDGKNLERNLLNYLCKLNQLTFNIRSTVCLDEQIDRLSNEEIQSTFEHFSNKRIISYVDYFSEINQGQCHIYSYPYRWAEYHQITNHFPTQISKCVRQISLFDQRPFEHEFFLRISKAFPYLKNLTVVNGKAQNEKQCAQLNGEDEHLSISEYPYLSLLNLIDAHDDYLEEFLLHTKTSLPNHLYFSVDYHGLKRVTECFTRNATRMNCAKLRSLGLIGKNRIPRYVKEYFPQTKIF